MADHGGFLGYGDALLWAITGDFAKGDRNPPLPVTCRYCLRCGTLVISEELHDVWHASHR